jgi:outer membrane receptor protein involved in Fe transport
MSARNLRAARACALLLTAAASSFSADVFAHPPAAENGAEVVVTGRRPMTAASSTTIRERDFLLRPHPRPADILSVTPGLYVVQHAGGGKANQYFLRGFDADHGTDVAISVDGVPVNLVSHGHGQGYADLHWVIPELVQRIEVHKGPYFAEHGDFATAGALDLTTRRSFERSQVSLTAGMFDTYRGLVIASPRLQGWKPVIAAEVYATDGPFEHGEHLDRYNVFAKVTRTFGGETPSDLSLNFTSYGSGWNASGQLPLREVRAGRLARFGSLDPTEGGNSQRHGVYGTYRAFPTPDSSFTLLAYLTQHRLNLFSNFTFFSRDPEHGDMIEQSDARTISGLSGNYRLLQRVGALTFDTSIGVQVRNDSIRNGLYSSRARERLVSVLDGNVREGSLALHAQEDATWTPWLRSVTGVRADYFGFQVDDRREDLATTGTRTSGVRKAALVSPKTSVILTPASALELYLNFGMGYHSNDARGVVRSMEPVTPLTRATGYESGARLHLFERLDLAVAVFALDLDSEIVWVGDEGTTEARGPTRRLGAELEARLEILPWLFADADVSVTRARFREAPGAADAVPLAPTRVGSAGVSVRHPHGYFGRIGAFHLADRPASEDRFFTADGFTRLDATLGYRHRVFELSVSGQNVTNVAWREAQFANVSRLPSETDASSCPAGTRAVEGDGAFQGCEDLHFTPGAPINVQATATLFF